ncbi:unnamed protein product [Ilex paraguariensis]|uniref:ER membrane protein complex subunit 6 n=1 Tax=Ilex paraguariensis TaxID=185542 RepID=A0ABC8V2Q4_9AQUA
MGKPIIQWALFNIFQDYWPKIRFYVLFGLQPNPLKPNDSNQIRPPEIRRPPEVQNTSDRSRLSGQFQELLQVQVMAGHDDSGTSDKKSSQAINDLPTFNAENMQNNMRVIYYSRTFMSIVGGFIAGIFGFTGLMGFIFYFLVMAITSVGLTAKAGFSIHSFFDSWNRILLDGFLGGLMVRFSIILLICALQVYLFVELFAYCFLGSTTA